MTDKSIMDHLQYWLDLSKIADADGDKKVSITEISSLLLETQVGS